MHIDLSLSWEHLFKGTFPDIVADLVFLFSFIKMYLWNGSYGIPLHVLIKKKNTHTKKLDTLFYT